MEGYGKEKRREMRREGGEERGEMVVNGKRDDIGNDGGKREEMNRGIVDTLRLNVYVFGLAMDYG